MTPVWKTSDVGHQKPRSDWDLRIQGRFYSCRTPNMLGLSLPLMRKGVLVYNLPSSYDHLLLCRHYNRTLRIGSLTNYTKFQDEQASFYFRPMVTELIIYILHFRGGGFGLVRLVQKTDSARSWHSVLLFSIMQVKQLDINVTLAQWS